jgi:hypothetical protein
VCKLSVAIMFDDSVMVMVKAQKGLPKTFTFAAIVAGAWKGKDDIGGQATYKDTDSIQVALRWQDKDGTDVGHDTNAMPQGERDVGAKWTFAGNTATWWSKKKAPACATKLNVIALYTDVLGGQDDLSVVMGSFVAKRNGAQWTIEVIKDDISKPATDWEVNALSDADIATNQLKTQKVLDMRTGYTMKRRLNPKPKKKGAEEGYNSWYDTGYDIDIRE